MTVSTGGPLSASPESLRAAAAELRAESVRIHAALSRLEQEAARLRDGWSGSARESYDAAHRTWSATFTAMKVLLEQVSRQADAAAADLIAADRSASLGFTKR